MSVRLHKDRIMIRDSHGAVTVVLHRDSHGGKSPQVTVTVVRLHKSRIMIRDSHGAEDRGGYHDARALAW